MSLSPQDFLFKRIAERWGVKKLLVLFVWACLASPSEAEWDDWFTTQRIALASYPYLSRDCDLDCEESTHLVSMQLTALLELWHQSPMFDTVRRDAGEVRDGASWEALIEYGDLASREYRFSWVVEGRSGVHVFWGDQSGERVAHGVCLRSIGDQVLEALERRSDWDIDVAGDWFVAEREVALISYRLFDQEGQFILYNPQASGGQGGTTRLNLVDEEQLHLMNTLIAARGCGQVDD
jgi:hypothetical protein